MASLFGGLYVIRDPNSHAMLVLVLPVMLGYAFLLVGGYRLVFGVSVKATPDQVSMLRILFGVAWIAFLFVTPIAVLMLLGVH